MSLHIHSLTCTNITSLAGSWQIDFDALGENPLYLITGATGTGKSTVLDAICMAFFGMTPRLGNLSGHADIMHEGADTCGSTVIFSIHGARYTVSCTISKSSRTGKVSPLKHILTNAEGQILASGTRDCRKEVEALLDMDASRFLRTTLLAQGQFASFLYADPKERAAILERITQTSIYSTLSIAAYERGSQLSAELEELERHLPEEQSEELLRCEKEYRARLMALAIVEDQASNAQKREALFIERQKKVQEALSLRLHLSTFTREAPNHSEACVTLREDVESYTKALATLPPRPLPPCAALYTEKESLARKLCELRDTIHHKEADHTTIMTKIAAKKDILARGNAIKFELVSKHLLDEKQKNTPLPDLRAWHTLRYELSRMPEGDDALYRQKAALYQAFSEQMAIVKSHRKSFREAIAIPKPEPSEPLRKTRERIALGLLQTKKIRILWFERGEKTKELPRLRQEEKALKERLDLQMTAFSALAFYRAWSELRKHTTLGSPCPLCGETVQSLPVIPKPSVIVEEKDLEATRTSLAATIQAKDRLLAIRQSYTREIRSLIEGACPLALESFLPELEACEAKARANEERYQQAQAILQAGSYQREYEKAVPLAQALLQFRKKYPGIRLHVLPLLQRREALFQEQKQLHAALVERLQNLRNIRRRIRHLQQEQKALEVCVRKDCEDIEALGPNLEERATNLAKTLQAIKQEEMLIERKYATLTASLEANERRYAVNYAAWEKARDLLRTLLPKVAPYAAKKKEAANYPTRAEDAAWKARRGALTTQYTMCRKMLQEASKHYHAIPDQGFAAEEWQKTRDYLLQKNTMLKEAQKEYTQQEETRKKLLTTIAQKRAAIVLPLELQKLIGSAKGDRFRIFAQSLTLERVLDRANTVLVSMMPRYRLERDQEEDLGILVDDDLMGGKLRSVRTLSGGESFVISLALALGLSAMSGTSSSLFLDEGFGTLDEESLQMVLAALQRLTNTGIACGIISHVQELKEAIPMQIHVLQNGHGRSRIEGIGCTCLDNNDNHS